MKKLAKRIEKILDAEEEEQLKKPNRKIVAIIPAKNEEKTISSVIADTGNYVDEILVINDGSTDSTQTEVFTSKKAMVSLVNNPTSFGKGASIMHSVWWLSNTRNPKFDDLVVFIDSDGQHVPNDIPKLIEVLDSEDLDMVIGARDLGKYPLHKKIGNWGLSLLASILAGHKIADGECGFRILRWERCLELLATINPTQYEIEMEINVTAGLRGWKFAFVDIQSPNYRPRQNIRSGIRNSWAGLKTWLKLTLKWLDYDRNKDRYEHKFGA